MSDRLPVLSLDTEPKFPLGHLVATPGVTRKIPREDIQSALNRHATGDWGELDAEDRRANESALIEDRRLVSAYESKDKTRFWIITEWDRSVTTILLPQEY